MPHCRVAITRHWLNEQCDEDEHARMLPTFFFTMSYSWVILNDADDEVVKQTYYDQPFYTYLVIKDMIHHYGMAA